MQNNSFDRVVFEYDAAGVRVSKTVIISGSSTKEYYIGGLVVQSNNTVKYFAIAEGRVRPFGSAQGGGFVYEYFITDQQGNVRVSFEDNGSGTAVARQENSYYPFGMPMNSNYMPTDANKKLYNAGSEWQDEFGGIIDYYSTFFREYDPVIGRFNGVDPKADATVELSIYHYSDNNPVNFNDPMGDWFGAPFVRYIDDHGNKWHAPGPLQGTGFGYSTYNWLNDAISHDSFMGWGSGGFGEPLISLAKVRDYFASAWSGTGRENIRARLSGGKHQGQGFDVTYSGPGVLPDQSDVLVGSNFYSYETMAALLGGEIWYYAYETGGMGHSLAYDPEMNAFYEKHYPYPAATTFGTFKDNIIYNNSKSKGYTWYLNVRQQRIDFWKFKGRGNLLLAPVFVPYPAISRAFFQNNEGNRVPYNLIWNNCKHYVLLGLRLGGAEAPTVGPMPAVFGGHAFTLSWIVGSPGPVPYQAPPPKAEFNIVPSPFQF